MSIAHISDGESGLSVRGKLNEVIDFTPVLDTAANFTANNPILNLGQLGIESDTLLSSSIAFKIGDGVHQWSVLPYANVSLSGLTTNKVLKAGSATTAVDSNIEDDGTNVVVNGLRIRSISNATYFNASGVNGHYWNSFDDAINLFRVKNDGVVNIPQGTSDRIMALDTNKDVVYLSTTVYPSLTELSYGKGVTSAIQTQLNAKSGLLLYKINTPIAHTGTTAATVIHSYEIYAGSLSANDFLKFSLRHLSTNNANNKTLKLWANTSNTIAGATQLATYTYTTNSGGVFWFKRTMFFQNSLSSQKIINTTVSHANDEVSYPNNGDSSLTLNFANSVWILIEVTLANAADTFTLNAYMNKIER